MFAENLLYNDFKFCRAKRRKFIALQMFFATFAFVNFQLKTPLIAEYAQPRAKELKFFTFVKIEILYVS